MAIHAFHPGWLSDQDVKELPKTVDNVTARLVEISKKQERRIMKFENVTSHLLEMNKEHPGRIAMFGNITARLSEIIKEQERQIVSNFEYKVVRHLAVSAKRTCFELLVLLGHLLLLLFLFSWETQQANYGLITGNPKYFIDCCLNE